MNKIVAWMFVLFSLSLLITSVIADNHETLEQKFQNDNVNWQDINAALESNPQLAQNYLEQNPNYISELNGRQRTVVLGQLILKGGEKNLDIVGKHFNKFGTGTQNSVPVNKNRKEFGRFLTKIGKGAKFDLSKLGSSKVTSWDGENLEWEESGVKKGDSCYKSKSGEVTCGKEGKRYKKPKKTKKKFNPKKAKNVKKVELTNEGIGFEEQDGNKVTLKGSGEIGRTELKDGTSYSLTVQGTPCPSSSSKICLDTITHTYKTNPKKPTKAKLTVDDSGNLEAENQGNGVGRVTSTLQDGQNIDARVRSGKININNNGDTTATDAKVTFTEAQPFVGGTTHRIVDGNFGRQGKKFLLLTGKNPTTLTDVSARRASQVTTAGQDVTVHTDQDAPAEKSGKNEVWINQDAKSYRATTRGKVTYTQARIDSLGNPLGNDEREPSFNGEKDSEFALEQKGIGPLALTKFKVKGKGKYEDGDKRITTSQQNSKVEQSFSSKGSTDFLRVRCTECKDGPAATAELKIFGTTQETRDVLDPFTGETRKVVITNVANQPKLPINFNVKNGKMSTSVDSKKLGQLQELASFAAVRQSKNVVIGIPGGTVGAMDGNIVFQAGGKKSSISLGLAKQLGSERLLRDAPETQKTLQAITQYAEQGVVPQLEGKEAKVFEQLTGVDPTIKSPEYRQRIQTGMQQFAAISVAQEALRKEGYEFDETGKCLAPRGCEERIPPELVSLRYNLQKAITKQKSSFLRADQIAAKEKNIDPDVYIGEYDEESIAAAFKEEGEIVAEEQALAQKEDNAIDRARGWERVVSGEYNNEEKRVLSEADAIGQSLERAERGLKLVSDPLGPLESRIASIEHDVRVRYQIRESDPVKRAIAIQESLQNNPEYQKLSIKANNYRAQIVTAQAAKDTAITRLSELRRTSPSYTHGEILRQAAGQSEAANDKSAFQQQLHQKAMQADREQFQGAESAGIEIGDSALAKAKGKEAYSLTQTGQYAKARQIASELEPGAGYTAYIDGMARYKLEGGEAALLAKLEAERQLRIARGKLRGDVYDPNMGFLPDLKAIYSGIDIGFNDGLPTLNIDIDERAFGRANWLVSNTLTDAGILVTDAFSPSVWYQAYHGQTETKLAASSIAHFESERLAAEQAMRGIMTSRSTNFVGLTQEERDGIQKGGSFGGGPALAENSFVKSNRFQHAIKAAKLSELNAAIAENPTPELIAQRNTLANEVKALQLGKTFEELETKSRVAGKYAVYGDMLKLSKKGNTVAQKWTEDNAAFYVGDVLSTGVEFAGADPFMAVSVVSALNKGRKVLQGIGKMKKADTILSTTGDIAEAKRALEGTNLQKFIGTTKNKAVASLVKKREIPGYAAASKLVSTTTKKVTPQSVQRALSTVGEVITKERYATEVGKRTELLKQAEARQNQLDSLRQQAQLPESSLRAAGTSPQQVRSQAAKAEQSATDAWKQFDTVNDELVATAEAKGLARDSRRISDSKLADAGISRQELEASQLGEVLPSSRVPEPAVLKSVDNKGSQVTRDGNVPSDSFTTGDKVVADTYEPKGVQPKETTPNTCGFVACAFASVGAGACGCDLASAVTQPVPPKKSSLRDLVAEHDFADSQSVSMADIPVESPPVMLQAAPPANPPSVAALETVQARKEVSSSIIAISRANGEEAIAARYAKQKLRGTEPAIPKWGRKIREDQLGDVANLERGTVSTNWGSGDMQVVYSSGVERQGTTLVRGEGLTRMNVDSPNPKDIAFIVVPDNKVDAARKAVGGKFEIVPASVARQEEGIVKAARLNSADRANVIVEGGHRIASPYTHDVVKAKAAGVSRKEFAKRVTEKLEAGDVLEKNGVHYVVNPGKKDMKRIRFHTVDTVPLNPKQTEEILDGGKRLGKIDPNADPMQAIANGQMSASAEVVPKRKTAPELSFDDIEVVDPAGSFDVVPDVKPGLSISNARISKEAEKYTNNPKVTEYFAKEAAKGKNAKLPRYYHATDIEGLRGILETGGIKVQNQQAKGGAFVSTIIESGTDVDYGDFAIAFTSDIERLDSSLPDIFDGKTWIGFQETIPTSNKDVAFIIAADDRIEEARLMVKELGLPFEVIPRSDANDMQRVLTQSREVLGDNKLILEGVLPPQARRVLGPESSEVLTYAKTYLKNFEEGEVIKYANRLYYVTKENDKVFLNEFQKATNSIQKHPLFATPQERFKVSEGFSLAEFMGNSFRKTERLGIKIDITKGEKNYYSMIERGDFEEFAIPITQYDQPVRGISSIPKAPAPQRVTVPDLTPPSLKVAPTSKTPASLAQDERIPDLIPKTYNEDDFVSPLHAAYYDLYRQKKIASVPNQPDEFAYPQKVLDVIHESDNLDAPLGGKFFFVESKNYKSGQGKIRFYVNAKDADSAHDIMADTARVLDSEGIPFSMKAPLSKSRFSSRVDNTVLYVAPEHRARAEELLKRVHSQKPTHFDPESPLLTKQLAPGLSWAEQPVKGRSFGEIRSKALAEARVASEGKAADEVEQITKQIFEKHGIDPDEPHLNLGSKNKEFTELPPEAVEVLPLPEASPLAKVHQGRVYEPEGLVWSVRDNKQLTNEQLAELGDRSFGSDGVVRDAETGQRFYVGRKGVNEQQLGAELGNFMAQRAGIDNLRYPEMRTANFGDGKVLLSEYAEGAIKLEYYPPSPGSPKTIDANLFGKADPEAGKFATVQNLWFRNWDLKAEHMLVNPDTGLMTVIDLEKGFGYELDALVSAKKTHPDGPDGYALERMAEQTNPYYAGNLDDFEDALKVIEGMTPEDYNTIRSMARKAGFDDINTERIVIELKQRQKTIRKDLENVLQQAKQRSQAPIVPNIETIPEPPSLETLVTIETSKFNPSTKSFLDEHKLVAVVDQKATSKDLTEEIELAMKGSIADELGIGQTKEFVDENGKHWFVKLGLDDATKEQGIDINIRDNLQRHKALENILRHEFGLPVPETKIVKGQDGFTYILSPKLDDYQILGKQNPNLGLDDFVKNNNIPADVAARLQGEMDLHGVINTQFRATDVELGVAKFDGEWHITRIDDEFAFSGFAPTLDGSYIMPHQVQRWSPSYDLNNFRFGGNDGIYTGLQKNDFVTDGDFNWDAFDSRLGTHVKNVEDVVHTEAGRARLRGYLMDAGYSETEAGHLIDQARGMGILEDEMHAIIQADGTVIADDGRKLISEDAFKDKYLPKETNVLVDSNPPKLELVVPGTVKGGGAPKIDQPIVDRNSVSNVVNKKALAVVPVEAKPDLRVLQAEQKRVSDLPAATPDEVLEKEISIRELLIEARNGQHSDDRVALIKSLEDELDVLAGQRDLEFIPPCKIGNLAGQAAGIPCGGKSVDIDLRGNLGDKLGNWLTSKEGKDFLDTEIGQTWYDEHKAPLWKRLWNTEVDVGSVGDDLPFEFARSQNLDPLKLGDFKKSRQSIENIVYGPESIEQFREYGAGSRAYYNRLTRKNGAVVTHGPLDQAEFSAVTGAQAFPPTEGFIGVNHPDFPYNPPLETSKFYFNARDSGSAGGISEYMVKQMQHEGIVYQLKTVADRSGYGHRVDNTVLYVPLADGDKVERMIRSVSFEGLVDPEVQILTKKIANGISRADSPTLIHSGSSTISVGQMKGNALDEIRYGIGGRELEEKQLFVIWDTVMAKHGLDPDEPWKLLDRGLEHPEAIHVLEDKVSATFIPPCKIGNIVGKAIKPTGGCSNPGKVARKLEARGISTDEINNLLETLPLEPVEVSTPERLSVKEKFSDSPVASSAAVKKYVGHETSLDDIVGEISDDTSTIVLASKERNAVVTFEATPSGDITMGYLPLTDGLNLEERIAQANRQLEVADELEHRLQELRSVQNSKMRVKRAKLKELGFDSDALTNQDIDKLFSSQKGSLIGNLQDTHRMLMTAGPRNTKKPKAEIANIALLEKMLPEDIDIYSPFRQTTTGGDYYFPDTILLRDDHLMAHQQAIREVSNDLVEFNPDHVLLTGRGGYPYEAAASNTGVPVERVLASSSAAPAKKEAYRGVGNTIDRLVQESGNEPVRLVVIDGGEYSGSSVTDFHNFLLTTYQPSSNRPVEVVLYTFAQNQRPEHFANLGRLTQPTREITNDGLIRVTHRKIDVPVALGEDAAITLGQVPRSKNHEADVFIEAQVPIVIFNKEGKVLQKIEPTDNTAAEFSRLLAQT